MARQALERRAQFSLWRKKYVQILQMQRFEADLFQLYGPQLYQSRILELNASDERGISVVREKIKDFARQQISSSHTMSKEYLQQYPCPNFKIIILDEADSLTQDAQSALRRTMELYSKVTRFCLCCNYVSRIIDPLASRCSKFRFKTLDGGDAAARLKEIMKAESVVCDDGVVEKLLQTSEGDLRRAITYLQSAHRLTSAMNSSSTNGHKSHRKVISDDDDDDEDDEMSDAPPAAGGIVTVKIIEEIAGVIPPATIDELASAMQGKAPVYNSVARCVENIVMDGWSANQLLQVRGTGVSL
jgi:replication factor C subunit 2/4